MRKPSVVAVLVGAFAVGSPAAAQTTLDTQSAPIHTYGEIGNSSGSSISYGWGQTFTVGADNILDQFSFLLRAGTNAADLRYRAYVWGWDNSTRRLSGSTALWRGDVQNGTTNSTYEPVTFNTGGLGLDAGSMYIAFLSPESLYAQTVWNTFAITRGSAYTGGDLVNMINGSAGYTYQGDYGYDAAFTATFSGASTVAPEPMSLVLLGTGLAGLAGAARRRRRRPAGDLSI